MKRLWGILGALAMVCALTSTAWATRLVVEPLKWMNSDVTVAGGQSFVAKKPIAVGVTDTTANFSVEGWALPNAAFSDSVVIGWVVIGIDSSVAYSPTATSFTINLDAGNSGSSWLNFGTTGAVTFTDVTTTDRLVKIPIYNNFALARGVTGSVGNWGPWMRMRIVSISGVWSAATLKIVRFADN